MRIAGLIRNSVVNGIGIRDVIFLQGCEHHCKGCHNPHTWSLHHGVEADIHLLAEQLKESKNHITISGGEPLLQYDQLIKFMELVNETQNKRFWLYTGFEYDEIPFEQLVELSKYVDVLVDGRYEEDKRDLRLAFRGSSNQRLIDLPKSLEEFKVVLWEGLHE